LTGAERLGARRPRCFAFTLKRRPAKARGGVLGAVGAVEATMMTQMAPSLKMMKAKMGKRPLRHDDADHRAEDEQRWTRRWRFGGRLGGGGIPGGLAARRAFATRRLRGWEWAAAV